MLGDLNDEPLAATTQILLGPPGSEIGTAGFDRPDRGDAARLWNLAPLIPAEHRSTRVFSGRRELIDHVLVSRFLVTRASAVDTGGVEPPSIGARPRARAATSRPPTTRRCSRASTSEPQPAGSVASMRVPAGPEVTSSVPPSSSTRSRMPARPKPAARRGRVEAAAVVDDAQPQRAVRLVRLRPPRA